MTGISSHAGRVFGVMLFVVLGWCLMPAAHAAADGPQQRIIVKFNSKLRLEPDNERAVPAALTLAAANYGVSLRPLREIATRRKEQERCVVGRQWSSRRSRRGEEAQERQEEGRGDHR